MIIDKQWLTISKYNRPGTRRGSTIAVACHYIGNPGTSAQANRNYFENLSKTHTTKASAHYIIGLRGEIIQMIPEDEISWCTNSANAYTISIEVCHPDSTGRFGAETYASYVALCADICKRWGLDPLHGGLIRHYDVTRKICPKWFVDHPADWERFKRDVAAKIAPRFDVGWNRDNNGWWYADTTQSYYKSCWQTINGHRYYFNPDGYALTNWQQISGKWYYFEPVAGHPLECALYVTDTDGVQWPGVFQ